MFGILCSILGFIVWLIVWIPWFLAQLGVDLFVMLGYWIRDTLRRWLGVTALEDRVVGLETRLSTLEEMVYRTLGQFGAYKTRTQQELALMRTIVQDYLGDLDELRQEDQNAHFGRRYYLLRRRLRNNLTRITNALAA